MINPENCKKDVSVIVPLYHGKKYLDSIIKIVKNNIMSAKNISIELVLVNDFPEEKLDLSIFSNESIDIKSVINNINLGIQRSRIRGMEESSGRFLLFLDQDDEISDDCIFKLFNAIKDRDAAISDWTDEQFRKDNVRKIVFEANRFRLSALSIRGNFIGPPGHILIRRDSIPKCWKNNIMKIAGADDYLLLLGMAAEGKTVSHCPENLYIHKDNPDSYSNDISRILDSEKEAFIIAAKEYGFSKFWLFIHNRSIFFRKRMFGL